MKRLWPRCVEIPEGWQLSEELSQVVALSHSDFLVIHAHKVGLRGPPRR